MQTEGTYVTCTWNSFILNHVYWPHIVIYFKNFHDNIKFTYEVEHNGKISLLDVILIRSNRKWGTTVFCNEKNNDKYLHSKAFAPVTWKKDKLRTLIRRAFTPISNDNVLKKESHHIERCLTEINDFKPPYKGNHGISLIRSIKTSAKKTLREKHDVKIILKSTKLSSQFNNKDGTNKQHKHDLDMILVVVRPQLELRVS